MNEYTVEFFVKCPGNGIRVKYQLTIECPRMVMVEEIQDVIEAETVGPVYHEDLANALAKTLPGRQTMVAHHHGVEVKTTRNGRDIDA